jgi:hypothetical protein
MIKYVLILSVLLQGCATLNSSKLSAIEQFGMATKDLPTYGEKFSQGISDARLKRSIYFANTLSTPTYHINELDSIYAQEKIDAKNTKLFNASFKVLGSYSKILKIIASTGYVNDYDSNVKELGYDIQYFMSLKNNFENSSKFIRISEKFGLLIGKYYIGYNQNKELTNIITTSDSLITIVADNMIEYLESESLKSIIINENNMLKRNYLTYIQQKTNTTISNDLEYIQLKKNLDNINILRGSLIRGITNLKEAHTILAKQMNSKNSNIDNINQIKDLMKTFIEINIISKQIK